MLKTKAYEVYSDFHRGSFPAAPARAAAGTGLQSDCIAYFSAEFDLTDCLPIYFGGLGILAGDHLKSASDLGLPLVEVGLL